MSAQLIYTIVLGVIALCSLPLLFALTMKDADDK